MPANKRQQKYAPHRGLSSFARQLLAEWRRLHLPKQDEAVVIAVSGGADSTALLLVLDELRRMEKLSLRLVVAHLDHRLRPTSKEDAKWVSELGRKLGYEVVVRRTNVRKRATANADNLEQAARRARYEFLRKTAEKVGSTTVVTAHTLDDQAETILMRLLRGSGAEGLSGADAMRPIEVNSPIRLGRPMLSWARRSDTESYCKARNTDFRVDEMNLDEKFVRVKVRRQLLPLMESFNSRVVETLSRTASLLSEDAAALSNEAAKLLAPALRDSPRQTGKTKLPLLDVKVLASSAPAIRRRALRQWLASGRGDLKRLEMAHILAVDRLLTGRGTGRVAELPGGARVIRRREWLELIVKDS